MGVYKDSNEWWGSARGFTLVELMAVVLIVAVIALIAAPAYTTLIERTQLKSYANELVASFYAARSEAIKRNSAMTMCVTTDGESCTGGGAWEQGWMVFYDDNGNGDVDDPDDVVVKRQQALPSGLVLFNLASTTFTSINFQPTGFVDLGAPVQMKLCKQTPSVGVEEKVIRVPPTGSPNVVTTRTGCP